MSNINKATTTPVTAGPVLESNYMGTVGEKIEVTGEVTLVKYIQSQFGSSTLINMVSKDGNIASFFSNNGAADNAIKGQVIKVIGKVKKHEEYNGKKRTVLFYTKVVNA
jgi:DNA/RNA endonuclease YhcR with UshA esterase domain